MMENAAEPKVALLKNHRAFFFPFAIISLKNSYTSQPVSRCYSYYSFFFSV